MRCATLLLLFGSLAWGQVDFVQEVHPLLMARCADCHSGPGAQANLRVEDKAGWIRVKDRLVAKVRGQDGMRMPPNGASLSAAQIAVLERWVAEGLPWTDTGSRKSTWKAPLTPRTVVVSGKRHPIDELLGGSFDAPVAADVFIRRVYLDLWGVAPTPEQLASARSLDRGALIDSLLAAREPFAAHWISFWNDLLRNDQRAYHGDPSKPYTAWLRDALTANAPYDEMVRNLVNPVPNIGPEGFLAGVNWRGDVNASQLPHMQAAQNTAQVFLGVNLKCASCHDSFVNRYKLRESYGMAAIFAAEPELELVRCDVKTGQRQAALFLFPELGKVPAGSITERRAAAASLFTKRENGRLARTFVNRIWGRLFGWAIVEPVDDMDAEPKYPDVLDWLAEDFASSGYDVNHLLRTILTSRAWQQPAGEAAGAKPRRPLPRRLTAEQILDTLSSATGEWRVLQGDKTARRVREWEGKASPLSRALGRPIRDQVYTTRATEFSTLQALEVVNGATLQRSLDRGARRLLGTLPDAPAPIYASGTLRRGSAEFAVPLNGVAETWLLVTDAGSYDPDRTLAGWYGLSFDGRPERPAAGAESRTLVSDKTEYAGADVIPFGKPVLLKPENGAKWLRGRVVIDDVGRLSDVNSAVRFYVFPKAPDLNLLTPIEGTSPMPLPGVESASDALVNRLFLQLLGRLPVAAERSMARDAVARGEAGLSDLLWVLALHPEFQYVR